MDSYFTNPSTSLVSFVSAGNVTKHIHGSYGIYLQVKAIKISHEDHTSMLIEGFDINGSSNIPSCTSMDYEVWASFKEAEPESLIGYK